MRQSFHGLAAIVKYQMKRDVLNRDVINGNPMPGYGTFVKRLLASGANYKPYAIKTLDGDKLTMLDTPSLDKK
jgi:hypothetical protein